MHCSTSFLAINSWLWQDPVIFDTLVKSYQNLSEQDSYDCGLTVAPCDSYLVDALISLNVGFLYWFDVAVVYVVMTLLLLTGIVGNISNIIIFSKYSIATDSTNNFLLGLSVSDLMNTVSCGLIVPIAFICFFDVSMAVTVKNVLGSRLFLLNRWFSLLSLDFVTCISIQRVLAVVVPFKVSTLLSNRNTNAIIAILVILCLSTMIPFQAIFYHNWVYHPYFKRVVSLGYTFLVDYTVSMSITTAYFMTRSVLDLLVIFITGSLTVYKIKGQAKSRSKLTTGETTSSTAESKVIKLSLTVCFVTFVIYSLNISVNAIILVMAEELFKTGLPMPAELVSTVLQMINSCFNFFVYLKMSKKYRDIFKNCFREKK